MYTLIVRVEKITFPRGPIKSKTSSVPHSTSCLQVITIQLIRQAHKAFTTVISHYYLLWGTGDKSFTMWALSELQFVYNYGIL